jgi:DNA topoisomerase-3
MEKLYNKGYLSYPRTETNKYVKSINLRELVQKLETHVFLG